MGFEEEGVALGKAGRKEKQVRYCTLELNGQIYPGSISVKRNIRAALGQDKTLEDASLTPAPPQVTAFKSTVLDQESGNSGSTGLCH